MSPDYPSYIFQEPGEYAIAPSLTCEGDSFSDTVKLTVLARPERAFPEQQGMVVIGEERYQQKWLTTKGLKDCV